MSRILPRLHLCALAVLACAGIAASPASAVNTYGTDALNISAASAAAPANGGSGQPSVSGDNRHARLVAFYSDASNLVRGDTNGVRDVYVWHRPGGRTGRTLRRIGTGSLSRASVAGRFGQANGASENPSVDGSMGTTPHCVAFQSRATNLSRYDRTADWDVYVRDLRKRRTVLVSRGVPFDAVNPSIDGRCRRVLFESGGRVYRASARLGRPRSLGTGTTPDFSLDGRSMTWVKNGIVVFKHRRHNRTIGPGSNPLVSDESSRHGWGVGYNAGGDVRLGIVRRGSARRTLTVARNAIVGSVSALVATRGIVVFARGSALYYFNKNTGNSDDLAYANAPISEIAASARANLIAFAAPGGLEFVDTPGNRTHSVYVKWLKK